jgi:hypothetical protein
MLRISLSAAAAFALAAAVLGAGACTRKNDEFCCTTVEACQRHGGDSDLVRCPADSERPYCDNQERTCIAPPGEPCGPDGECDDPATPVCFEGLCVECDGAADCPFSSPVCGAADHQCQSCMEATECDGFDGRPFCEEGACVGCRDGNDCAEETAPICDDAERACRGCVSGAECESDVCDWIDGGCVAEEDVLYVATDGSGGGDCTRDDPCDSITQAIDVAAGRRNWILVAAGDYQESVAVSGETVRIIGEEASLRPGAFDEAAITVSSAANLRVSGLRIHDADGNGDGPGDGIYCTNSGGAPTVLLDQVIIERNDDQGIDANNCNLTLSRSIVRDNRRGGIDLDSVDFDITNNFILANGSGGTVSAGVLVDKFPPTAGRLEHNTIVGNVNPSGSPSGVQCVLVGNALTFRNNIIYDNLGSDTQVEGDNCEHRFSVIGPEAAGGAGNVQTAPTFASDSDFHLAAGSSGIDVAEDGDVAIDFDGEPRPGSGANDIGADEIP